MQLKIEMVRTLNRIIRNWH